MKIKLNELGGVGLAAPQVNVSKQIIEEEINLLDRLVKKKRSEDGQNKNLSYYLT